MNRSGIINIPLLFLLITVNTRAMELPDSSNVDRKLLRNIVIAESAASVLTLGVLYVSWYSDYPHTSFHFFNDNREWQQLDKMGHITASYNIGRLGYDLLRWPGVDRKRSVWYGGTLGLAYMTVVEIMDGFSEGWGASPGDIATNTFGAGLFIGQQLAWDEQRIFVKLSYHESGYAQYRPGVLGGNLPERILKDYNGQTFWLSANISSFLPDNSGFPEWLNAAFGYSGEGLLGGTYNPAEVDGTPLPSFERRRRYFFSFDLDLTHIETRSKALRMIFNVLSIVKVPFPAVEFNQGTGWRLHGVYF